MRWAAFRSCILTDVSFSKGLPCSNKEADVVFVVLDPWGPRSLGYIMGKGPVDDTQN